MHTSLATLPSSSSFHARRREVPSATGGAACGVNRPPAATQCIDSANCTPPQRCVNMVCTTPAGTSPPGGTPQVTLGTNVANAIGAIAGASASLVQGIVNSNNETERARIADATQRFIVQQQAQMASETNVSRRAEMLIQLQQAEALQRALAPRNTGMSTGTKVALGVGAVAVVGGGAYYLATRGGARSPMSAPDVSLDTVKDVGWDMLTVGGSAMVSAFIVGSLLTSLYRPGPDISSGYMTKAGALMVLSGVGMGVVAHMLNAPRYAIIGASVGPALMGAMAIWTSSRAERRELQAMAYGNPAALFLEAA